MSDPAAPKEAKESKDKDEKKVKKKKIAKPAEGKSKSSSRKSSTVPVENANAVEAPEEQGVEPGQNDKKNILTSESAVEADKPEAAAPQSETNEINATDDKKSQNEAEGTTQATPVAEERRKSAGTAQVQSKSLDLQEVDFSKLAELKEAFHLFDFDRDGFIDKKDLKFTFASLGKPEVSDEQLEQMLSEMPNPVDFDAFVTIFGYKTLELDPENVLLDALSKWDYEGQGMISEERIRHDLLVWGDKWTKSEMDFAFEEAPLYNKMGRTMIDYIKFCNNLCGLQKVQKSRQIEKEANAKEEELKAM